MCQQMFVIPLTCSQDYLLIIDPANSEDDWSQDETEIPAGVTDTMLTPTDFVDDDERQHIYNVAPAEANRPLSLFRDQYS